MRNLPKVVIAAAAAAALVLGAVAPAHADHTAGAGLYSGTPDQPYADGQCYLGPLASGIPLLLVTKQFRTYERQGYLHLVCLFKTPKTVYADDPDYVDVGGSEDPWVAPRVRTTSEVFPCLAPGSDAAGYIEGQPMATGTLVHKDTHLVMHCAWPLSDL